VELSSNGAQKNRNSTRKKVSIHHCVVKIVVQKHEQTSITEEAEAAVIAARDNLSL
jgi:hypothetical protein